MSERKVDNTLKFYHISKILKGFDAVLDGEVYIPFKTVIDLNKKENWSRAKFVVFDIIELKGEDLRNFSLKERRHILSDFFKETGIVHIPVEFLTVDVAWDYVLQNKLEGLILKEWSSHYSFKDIFETDRRKTWIKCKNWKEEKSKIKGLEYGSSHGTFVLENNARISTLSLEVRDKWLSVKDLKDIYAEFQYLNRTEAGNYFQPTLKRLVDKEGIVLWE